MSSDFKGHISCEKCGSSDANSVYSDNHTYCFKCGHRTAGDIMRDTTLDGRLESFAVSAPRSIRPLAQTFSDFVGRSLSKSTMQKYSVTLGHPENDKVQAVYPFFDKDNKHVANKIRFEGKEFVIEGDWKGSTLFGQQAFPAGCSKQITLTEGQDDAMAAYQMQGSKFPCVSVSSASSAVKDVGKAFEYLNSFDQIVIAFDNDGPGKEAAKLVAAMFAIGKARVLTLTDYKDANDYLINDKKEQFIREWWAAPVFMPGGLKFGKDMWDEIKTPRKYETVDYPWEGLQKSTYGIRLSEFVLVTAQTKVGKTAMLKEIAVKIQEQTKAAIGFLFLEESNYDTSIGLMSVKASKPLHLPDVRAEIPENELRTYFDAVCNTDRVVLWDHFGSNSIDEILSKVRHMHNLGCKYIILDHLSIIVSDQSGDERKQLDEISTKLKMLCMELNVAIIAVIHQNRNNQIRSSAGPEQIANITVKLHRELEDADEWRRNVTKVSVQYNRFCGRTGPCCYLYYDSDTGRLTELDQQSVDRYENKKVEAMTKESWK